MERVWPSTYARYKEPPPKIAVRSDGIEILPTEDFVNELTDNIHECYKARECADFTIATNEGAIPCHQTVLAVHSPVLKAMLDVETEEALIKITNFSHDCLEALVRYMYTGNMSLTRENIQELLIAADFMQMEVLKDQLCYKLCDYDGYFTAETCLEWRGIAERLNLPKVAKAVKIEIVASFFKLMTLECFFQIDFIEIGRFMKEMAVDRVPKDYQVDAVLRWMHYYANEESMAWMSDEDLGKFIELIVDQWVIAPYETDVLKAREYKTMYDRSGSFLHNELMVHRALQENALENMTDKVEQARIKAEIAAARAEHLRRQPPRIVPKYPSSKIFETFKEMFLAHLAKTGALEGKSEEDIEARVEDEYYTFVDSKRFKHAIGVALFAVIEVDKCSIPFLNEVVKVLNGGTTDSLFETKHILDAPDAIKSKIKETADKADPSELYTPRPSRYPKRMTIVGGRFKLADRDWDDECREMYITYDNKEFKKMTKVPSKIHPMWSSFCEFPPGIMITGGMRSKHCCMYDTMGRDYIIFCPMPLKKDCHTMAFANNRAYVVGGRFISKWYNMVEYYDYNDRWWHHGPDAPEGFVEPHASGMGSDLYVLHSFKRLHRLNDVSIVWHEMAPLPDEAPEARIANDGKRVYVAGGKNRVCFAFTPAENKWEVLSGPRLEHRHGALCCLNNQLYLSGGVESTAIEVYDIENDVWSDSPLELPEVRCCHYALVVEAEEPKESDYTKWGYPYRQFSWREEEEKRYQAELKKEEEEKKKKEEEEKQAQEEEKEQEEEDEKMQEEEEEKMQEDEEEAE